MLVDLVGQSGRDSDNVTANPARLVNVYAENTVEGSRVLKSVLGMSKHTQLGGVMVRAMSQVQAATVAVCGGHMWRIDADGTSTDIGEVATGPASLASWNGDVVCQAGSRYFAYSGGVLSEPDVSGEFTAIGSVEYFDGYVVLTEANGRMFRWSSLADPTDMPALNFSDADSNDDVILRGIALQGRLMLFKEHSTEIWMTTGEAGASAFSRVPGGVVDTGLKHRDLVAKFTGGAFCVSSDNRVTVIAGDSYEPISTPPVETAIKLHGPKACFAYEDEGHCFLVVTFKDAPAWCYDIAMGEWHERAEGVNLSAWDVAGSARLGDQWVVGRNSGEISILERRNIDGDVPLVREITSRTLQMDGNRTVLREFEIFPRRGHSAGTMDLQISRDLGATWTPPKSKSIGDKGVFGQRVIWRNLGQSRQVTAKLRWTDIADISLSTQGRIVT